MEVYVNESPSFRLPGGFTIAAGQDHTVLFSFQVPATPGTKGGQEGKTPAWIPVNDGRKYITIFRQFSDRPISNSIKQGFLFHIQGEIDEIHGLSDICPVKYRS